MGELTASFHCDDKFAQIILYHCSIAGSHGSFSCGDGALPLTMKAFVLR
jgi:hypothetical protein